MKTIQNLRFLAAAFTLMVAASSCEKISGKGPVVTEERNLSGFTEIEFDIAGEMKIEKGASYSLKINAQRNILDEIESHTNGTRLKLNFKEGVRVRDFEPITVYVTVPELTALKIGGSGGIETRGVFSGNELNLTINGSGDITMEHASFSLLKAWLNGSGDIVINGGAANQADLTIAGSGAMRMENLETGTVHATTNGSGNMRVWAKDQLHATINGSGSIFYKGEPGVVNANVAGSGRVSKL